MSLIEQYGPRESMAYDVVIVGGGPAGLSAAIRLKQLAGSLSGGEAQMLAMARGLMSDPKVLIIDEPSLGLAPVMVNELFEILGRLKQDGRTIILVEQNTHRAVGVADHVYLMQSGKVVLSQAASEVSLDHLHDLYFAR